MMKLPKTVEEARATRYGKWGGNPNGAAWIEGQCAERVAERERGGTSHQCNNKSGHGPCGLYCKEHARQFGEKLTWYSTGCGISEVQITSFTDNFVWLESGRKTSRHSPYECFFPTRDEAKQYLIGKAVQRVNRATVELTWATEALEKAKAL